MPHHKYIICHTPLKQMLYIQPWFVRQSLCTVWVSLLFYCNYLADGIGLCIKDNTSDIYQDLYRDPACTGGV
jgi:hypothetical protein